MKIRPLRKPFIDQADWGHPSPYPNFSRWPSYDPTLWVIHYGGGRPYGVATTRAMKSLMLRWRNFHVGKGWNDIAYNRGAWHPPVRLRGLNHNGANSGSNHWGGITMTVVFPVGVGETPHRRSLKGFACMWIESPGPVTGHGLLPPTPDGTEQRTSCPGKWLKQWIVDEGWIAELGIMRYGKTNARVRSLKRRLTDLGYWHGNTSRYFGGKLRRAVKQYQSDHGLTADGVVGPLTWRALSE